MEEKEEKFNEVMTENSKLESIKPHLPFIKGSLCLCKIRCPSFPGNFGQRDMYQMKNSSGSGFFIKIKNPDNNQEFKYFIITCEHVVQKEIIEKDAINIYVDYYYETLTLELILDKYERFIKEYMTEISLDITIIEINPDKDKIPSLLFLEPDYEILNENNNYLNKKIIIHQYPLGSEQFFSTGEIIQIENNNEIFHNASSQPGSSGSPIILCNSDKIIGIHNGGFSKKKKNFGYFINEILKDIYEHSELNYHKEYNIEHYNYSKKDVYIEKAIDSRKYIVGTYKIIFKRKNDNLINLTIENIFNDKKYNYNNIPYINLDEIFNNYDKYIYNVNINEKSDELEFRIGQNNYLLKIEKKYEREIKLKSLDINLFKEYHFYLNIIIFGDYDKNQIEKDLINIEVIKPDNKLELRYFKTAEHRINNEWKYYFFKNENNILEKIFDFIRDKWMKKEHEYFNLIIFYSNLNDMKP